MPIPPNKRKGRVLFDPIDLLHWLDVVGVFEIGTRPDGTRLRVEDYPHFFQTQIPI